jgi:hypothetical protein
VLVVSLLVAAPEMLVMMQVLFIQAIGVGKSVDAVIDIGNTRG